MRRYIAIGALYLALCVFNFGALNAPEANKRCWGGEGIFTPRGMAGVAALFSLLPIAGTAAAIFGTGFMEYGWTLRIGCIGDKAR